MTWDAVGYPGRGEGYRIVAEVGPQIGNAKDFTSKSQKWRIGHRGSEREDLITRQQSGKPP